MFLKDNQHPSNIAKSIVHVPMINRLCSFFKRFVFKNELTTLRS